MNTVGDHGDSASPPTPIEARILAIFAIVAATSIVAALGGLVSGGGEDEWYRALKKAPGTPPDFVFAVVWPLLYSLMTIGAVLAWNAAGSWRRADEALGVYFLQLAANLGWSALFFHLHQPLAALIDLGILWVLIAVMIREFAPLSRVGAQLQVPYIVWVSFALYLNVWVVAAN